MAEILDRLKMHKAILPQFLGYSLFIFCVFCVAVGLVYQYWYGENGYYALENIRSKLDAQLEMNQRQEQENNRLRADVTDLLSGLVATEEHARVDLGLIKAGELFVQVAETSNTLDEVPTIPYEPDAVEVVGILDDALNPIDGQANEPH